MDRELRDLHRGARDERRRALMNDPGPIPDHEREGKTLPQQIEGDHAYRDEPPQHGIPCDLCGREHRDVEGALYCCSPVLEPDPLVEVEHYAPEIPELGGEIVLSIDELDGLEYDVDDQGDGRLVLQFWDSDTIEDVDEGQP